MSLHSARHQGHIVLLWAAAMLTETTMAMFADQATRARSTGPSTAPRTANAVVALQNPMQLFDTTGVRMNVHDGDVRQWTPGGPYYYYGMYYDRCHYIYCGGPKCSHLHDHKVLIWRSDTLTNRSWTLVGEALGPQPTLGTFYRPHVQYNPTTKLWVLVVNGNGLGLYKYFASTSTSPEGPFTAPQDMNLLYYEQQKAQMGDFGFFAEGEQAYLVVNVMTGAGAGVHVEKLNDAWTNGLNDTRQTSACLNCGLPPQESPSMYKTAAGKFVVLLAGATCFGVPQSDSGQWGPNGNLPVGPATKPWGGTGVFVYVADSPLGPYTYHGDINTANHTAPPAAPPPANEGESHRGALDERSSTSRVAATNGRLAEGSIFCGECGPNVAPNPGKEVYQTLTLECASSTIAAIDFAKFGLPLGHCGNYTPGTECPASCPPYHCDADTEAWVKRTCLGKKACSLDPMSALGDTCPNHFKKLAVQARCLSGSGTAVPKRGTPPPAPAPICGACMGNPCPAGKCVLPIQLNSIVRDHTGAPLALTGGMWARNSADQVTNILGDYAEYWQPWSDVISAASGLPKQLTYLSRFTLALPSAATLSSEEK